MISCRSFSAVASAVSRCRRPVRGRCRIGSACRAFLLAQLNAASEIDWSRVVIDGTHIDTKTRTDRRPPATGTRPAARNPTALQGFLGWQHIPRPRSWRVAPTPQADLITRKAMPISLPRSRPKPILAKGKHSTCGRERDLSASNVHDHWAGRLQPPRRRRVRTWGTASASVRRGRSVRRAVPCSDGKVGGCTARPCRRTAGRP